MTPLQVHHDTTAARTTKPLDKAPSSAGAGAGSSRPALSPLPSLPLLPCSLPAAHPVSEARPPHAGSAASAAAAATRGAGGGGRPQVQLKLQPLLLKP